MSFPKLQSLALVSFTIENPAQAMEFWENHPSLEILTLLSVDDDIRWFANSDAVLPGRFLPNLKHLRSHFFDIRMLAPILNQLVSLTVYGSINGQIPYLLRYVLPDGLPNLKSLDIHQKINSANNVNSEGALWYETEDGEFCEVINASRGAPMVRGGYIHSITRGAPNLEEIGLNSFYNTRITDLAKLASQIAGLSKLRRLFHEGPEERHEVIIQNATTLAEACDKLVAIVNTNRVNPPYLTARISRTESGGVRSIDVGSGYGMHIGNDDEAFPGTMYG